MSVQSRSRLESFTIGLQQALCCVRDRKSPKAIASPQITSDISESVPILSTRVDDSTEALQDARPSTPKEQSVIWGRGDFISGGVSGLIERLENGHAIKSPWPGSRARDSRDEITSEAQIYTALGSHPRLLRIIEWDPSDCTLTMEYMRNGTIATYMQDHPDLKLKRKLKWAIQAAEGVQLLHSAEVIHCDVKPGNFLVDDELNLKIIDFACASFQGSRPAGWTDTAYLAPDAPWTFSVQTDIFALGSLAYYIMTGHEPLEGTPNSRITDRYRSGDFAATDGIACGFVMEKCWRGDYRSAAEVASAFKKLLPQY